ncbi:MAG: thioredoxin fold domain-containing protein [Gammaproteobacteria bacterium]|nr:MAG: thioredoxin fold domain-containing protein [Gammaproteobacteria bacterium]
MILVNRLLTNLPVLLVIALFAGTGNADSGKGRYTGAETSEHPDWFKESFLDFEEDVQEAADRNKRVMLYFHQDGCPYCSKLVKDNFRQTDIVENMQASLESIAINMWGDREVVTIEGKPYTEKTLAAALRVNYTPTLIFLDEQGKVALRLNGYYPPDEFRLALEYVAGHKETELSFHDYITEQSTAASGKLNPEPFFLSPPYALARNVIPADRPLAVFFEQAACAKCDILHEKILADPATRKLVEQLETVQLDMRADTPVITPGGEKTTARNWAGKLDLGYAPSIVFFDRKGKEVMRIDAFLKTFHVQSIFDYVLQEAYLEEPSFQRFISSRAERLVEEGIDVDIFGY